MMRDNPIWQLCLVSGVFFWGMLAGALWITPPVSVFNIGACIFMALLLSVETLVRFGKDKPNEESVSKEVQDQ